MRGIQTESHLVSLNPPHLFNKITPAQALASMKREPHYKKRHNIRACLDVNLHSNNNHNMLRWYHPKILLFKDHKQHLMQWTLHLRWSNPILSALQPKIHMQLEEQQPKEEIRYQYRQFRFIHLRHEFRLRRNSNESMEGMLKICAMIMNNWLNKY